MMYGYGFGGGWMWFFGIVLVLVLLTLIALVTLLAVRGASAAPVGPPPQVVLGPARQIAEERLARGEITADEFRQLMRALDNQR